MVVCSRGATTRKTGPITRTLKLSKSDNNLVSLITEIRLASIIASLNLGLNKFLRTRLSMKASGSKESI